MKTDKTIKNTKKEAGFTENHVIHVHTTEDSFFESETYSVIKDCENLDRTN